MDKWKIFMMSLALMTMGLVATSCSSDDDDNGSSGAKEEKVSVSELTLTGGSTATASFSVQANTKPTVESSESWCRVENEASTSATVYKYKVSADPNTGTDARTAIITVKTNGKVIGEVTVTQDAADGLVVETSSDISNFAAEGGEFTVKVTANVDVSVSCSATWVREKAGTRVKTMTESTKTFVVDMNRLTDPREATITFTAGAATPVTLTVKQQAGSGTSSGSMDSDDPLEVAQALGLGWNLGNQMDAWDNGVANETCWGNGAATQATFDKLAAAGFASVRIPVTWMGHIGAAPDYTIDAAWLDRVAELVGYAENAGLKAIINIHHDGADSAYWLDIKNAAKDATLNTAIKEQLKAMWTQIAERFKDKGNFLVFESLNEIHDGGWGWGENRNDGGKQYRTLDEWNQTFVSAVRAVGGKNTMRWLGIPGYCANPDLTMGIMNLPSDASNRLMVAVHYYAPTEFTLEASYSEWGHTGSNVPSWGDESYLKDTFSKLHNAYVNQGIPVYLGEMGCVHRNDSRAESFRKYYLEYLCKAAADYGLAPFYWDNGSTGAGRECSGLINHATGAYINNAEEVIEAMLRGLLTTDASYTLDTVYNNAPQ